MIIQLENKINKVQLEKIHSILDELGLKEVRIKTQFQNYIVVIPNKNEFDIRRIGNLDGIKDIHRVTDNYKLVSKKWKVKSTEIDLGDNVIIGDNHFTMMAGPCSIESEDQVKQTVQNLLKNNVKIMRGGVYKPRSSPYSFRGLGIEGLKMFYNECRDNGIKIITEVMQVSQIDEMIDYVDVFQVGARNTQNFNLLDALGGIDKAVMIKRGVSGSIDELLQSAEYVFSAGNEKIILCERGIRTFEKASRNTFDINAIPILKEKSHLPVIADPSHGIGIRKHVESITLAALAAGADGAIVEMHHTPEIAFSDGQQNLNFQEFNQLMIKVRALEKVLKIQ